MKTRNWFCRGAANSWGCIGKYDSKYIKAELDSKEVAARFLKQASDAEIKERKEQRLAIALSNIESASAEVFNGTFNNSWAMF